MHEAKIKTLTNIQDDLNKLAPKTSLQRDAIIRIGTAINCLTRDDAAQAKASADVPTPEAAPAATAGKPAPDKK